MFDVRFGPKKGTIQLETPKDSTHREAPTKFFTFDTVFGMDSTQMEVYNRVARPIVANVIEG